MNIKIKEVTIPVDDAFLHGDLHLVENAKGIIIFAHGSGSSRRSERNKAVADVLNQNNLSTLLFDLLTEEEEPIDLESHALRFNIPLLAHRLITVTQWIEQTHHQTKNQKIGYFGASTGAAAALLAAARHPDHVVAIVSRGGRPDLAKEHLKDVSAPTLLIVGAQDTEVITLNEQAYNALTCEKKIVLIPGATHLFEEPGTLEQVAQISADWFSNHM